jgi:N-acetylglucosamine malate deacetylase 1
MNIHKVNKEYMIDIVAFGAHPDDIEFGCGGILAKASSQGHSILLVDLTIGEKATNGSPEVRRQEGKNAARAINAERIVLDFPDCEIFDTYEGRLKLVRVIREYRPKLVLAPSWKGEQTHPDHIACGQMARYACRFARFAKILPELPIHRVEGILHYISQAERAEILIDVSSAMDLWKKMMEAHQSQLNTFPYIEWVVRQAAFYGTMIGKPYAQGLIAGNPIEVEDIMSISKGTREI